MILRSRNKRIENMRRNRTARTRKISSVLRSNLGQYKNEAKAQLILMILIYFDHEPKEWTKYAACYDPV